ncbi:hypothetical protein LXL04_017547 [Taraxacum kok-saghyz]
MPSKTLNISSHDRIPLFNSVVVNLQLRAGHGGRVSITRSYVQALEASIAKNFKDNGCIACMCHNTDGLYCAKQTTISWASDDFYPHDPTSHTIHISSDSWTLTYVSPSELGYQICLTIRCLWEVYHISLYGTYLEATVDGD